MASWETSRHCSINNAWARYIRQLPVYVPLVCSIYRQSSEESFQDSTVISSAEYKKNSISSSAFFAVIAGALSCQWYSAAHCSFCISIVAVITVKHILLCSFLFQHTLMCEDGVNHVSVCHRSAVSVQFWIDCRHKSLLKT